MSNRTYVLGAAVDLERLIPPPEAADPSLHFRDYCDVIAHYTRSSIRADRLLTTSVDVRTEDGNYVVRLDGGDDQALLDQFAARHIELLSRRAGLKALRGQELMEGLGVWNPMEGCVVNHNPGDGTCKWHVLPPLGLNIIGQRAILLMHYPPWQIVQEATFSNAMTCARWGHVLIAAGMSPELADGCQTIVDVNPIAAPGSGQSEYPNDYFPIMMASGFFDGGPDRDYIRSMLELYLNPPSNEDNDYTLPLLICGSPRYDPQAPGWFRTAYKELLKDEHNIPRVDVLQSGTFTVREDSAKETPYMVANHMIAAGVTGVCTDDPSAMPDIRLYEAMDLMAATFLRLLAENPTLTAEAASVQASARWFGAPSPFAESTQRNSMGERAYLAPNPPDPEDKLVICALAQMDMFFSPQPTPHDTYSFDEAMARCRGASDAGNPCCHDIAPPSGT